MGPRGPSAAAAEALPPRSGAFRIEYTGKLLNTRSAHWGLAEQFQLRSFMVGGQWAQARLYKAGRALPGLRTVCGIARNEGMKIHGNRRSGGGSAAGKFGSLAEVPCSDPWILHF